MNIKNFTLISASLLFFNGISNAQSADFSHHSNPFAKKYTYTERATNPVKQNDSVRAKPNSLPNNTQRQQRLNYTPKTPKESEYANLINISPEIRGCWDAAGEMYKIDPWLLMAFAKVESSFNHNAINDANRNRTTDYGIMQINSWWLPTLEKKGISRDDLFKPCLNIFIGAWIVRQSIDMLGYNTQGFGAYNAGTSKNRYNTREAYGKKIYAAYYQILNDFSVNVGNKK